MTKSAGARVEQECSKSAGARVDLSNPCYPLKSVAAFSYLPIRTRNLKLETRNCILVLRGAVAQFGRAPRSQCGGQGFEPPLLHQDPSTFSCLRDASHGFEFPYDQYVTKFFRRRSRSPLESSAWRFSQRLVMYMRANNLTAS